MNPYRRHLLHARAALAAAAGLLLATAAAGQPFGPVEGGRVATFGAGFARYPRFYDGDAREARHVSRLNVTTGTLGAQVEVARVGPLQVGLAAMGQIASFKTTVPTGDPASE